MSPGASAWSGATWSTLLGDVLKEDAPAAAARGTSAPAVQSSGTAAAAARIRFRFTRVTACLVAMFLRTRSDGLFPPRPKRPSRIRHRRLTWDSEPIPSLKVDDAGGEREDPHPSR